MSNNLYSSVILPLFPISKTISGQLLNKLAKPILTPPVG